MDDLRQINGCNDDSVLITFFQSNNELQAQFTNGIITGTEAFDALSKSIERAKEEMNKIKYLENLIVKGVINAGPRPMKRDSKGREWEWRPFGGKGKQFKGKTKQGVIDKVYDYLQASQHSIKEYTLSECIELYKEFRRENVSMNTLAHYSYDMERFLKPLMSRKISDITEAELIKSIKASVGYQVTRQKAYNNFMNTCNAVFWFSSEELKQNTVSIKKVKETLSHSIKDNVFQPTEDDEDIDWVNSKRRYSYQELDKLKEACLRRNSIKSLAILLLVYIGLRISELCGLKISNIDLDNHKIYIYEAAIVARKQEGEYSYSLGKPKKQKYRTIIIPSAAVELIKKIMEKRNDSDSEFLLPATEKSRKSKWMTRKILDDEIRSICHNELGMTEHVQDENGNFFDKPYAKSAHDIRRTYDSILDESGLIPTATRKSLMGHSLKGIDRNYLKNGLECEEIYNRLNEIFLPLDAEGVVNRVTHRVTPQSATQTKKEGTPQNTRVPT